MSDDLHKLTELLNVEFVSATEWIKKLNYGVRARVQLHKDEDATHYLAFGKSGGEWMLLHETAYQDGVEEWQPLKVASRELRIEAAFQLNSLLLALNEAETAEVQRVTAAVDSVRRFREAMSKHFTKKGSPP